MPAKLKIFSSPKFITSGKQVEVMLWPFFGRKPEDSANPNTGRYDKYIEQAPSLFELTDVERCDIAVLPTAWDSKDNLQKTFIALAKRYKKPIILFFNYDSTEDIPVPNSFIFRTSFYHTDKKPREFAQPGWSEDFMERYCGGQLPLRQKAAKPTVSYCGYAGRWKLKVKKFLGRALHPGEVIRSRALDILWRSPEIATNFLIRNGFWAGIYKNVPPGQTPPNIMQVRKEYVQNMIEGDYVLCSRGGGNFSYRFYETLSLGRIPIFINTDCVLPYDRLINYKQLCVWVEEKDLDKIDKILLDYHHSLSPAEFLERQKECRKVWEEWLCPLGFFKNFYRHFAR